MILEVQISTFGADGLKRTGKMSLPEIKNVTYTICFQNPDRVDYELPANLNRKDIRILEHSSRGLSNNRNYGLQHAEGDIILFSDDDLVYYDDGLSAIIDCFERHPEITFAAFMHTGGDNKTYPDYEFDFSSKPPRCYYLSSCELVIRRKNVPANIRFSPNMGVGTSLFGAAEECVFTHRLKRYGLKGRFFPIVIVDHAGDTTGRRESSPAVLRAQGAWLWINHGWIGGWLRLMVDFRRRNASLAKSFRYMADGFLRAHTFFNRDGSDKDFD